MSLSKDEIEQLLNSEEIVYVATLKPDGKPHLVPLWFVYENGTIFLYTKRTTKKCRNLEVNKNISLCFGGKETYIVEGKVKLHDFNDAPVDMKSKLWEKYPSQMRDKYVNPEWIVVEIIPEKEMSWHYNK